MKNKKIIPNNGHFEMKLIWQDLQNMQELKKFKLNHKFTDGYTQIKIADSETIKSVSWTVNLEIHTI